MSNYNIERLADDLFARYANYANCVGTFASLDLSQVVAGVSLRAFSHEEPFEPDNPDLIILTKSDCYSCNSPFALSVGCVHHAHAALDDRGYIRGVAVSLSGFLKLRRLRLIFERARLLYSAFDTMAVSELDRMGRLSLGQKKEVIELASKRLRDCCLQVNEEAYPVMCAVDEHACRLLGDNRDLFHLFSHVI